MTTTYRVSHPNCRGAVTVSAQDKSEAVRNAASMIFGRDDLRVTLCYSRDTTIHGPHVRLWLDSFEYLVVGRIADFDVEQVAA